MLYSEDMQVWDIFMSLLLTFSCFVMPLELCFTYESTGYLIMSYTVDCLFLLDIFVCFNLAVQTEDFEEIDDHKKIACEYLKGWFWIDTIAIIPFQLMMPTVDESSNNADVNGIVRILRVGKLTKLVKIVKLLRLLKFLKNDNRVQSITRDSMQLNVVIERLVFLVLMTTLCVHIISCMWLFAAVF